jgi:hypothetical protein
MTDLERVQEGIDKLAQMATPNLDILNHPIVKAFEVHQETKLQYQSPSITDIPVGQKKDLLAGYLELIEDPVIVNSSS